MLLDSYNVPLMFDTEQFIEGYIIITLALWFIIAPIIVTKSIIDYIVEKTYDFFIQTKD